MIEIVRSTTQARHRAYMHACMQVTEWKHAETKKSQTLSIDMSLPANIKSSPPTPQNPHFPLSPSHPLPPPLLTSSTPPPPLPPHPLPSQICLHPPSRFRRAICLQRRRPHLSLAALPRFVSHDICEEEGFGFCDFGAESWGVLEAVGLVG